MEPQISAFSLKANFPIIQREFILLLSISQPRIATLSTNIIVTAIKKKSNVYQEELIKRKKQH